MDNWYALHAKPHKEMHVANQLRQQNIEVCLPMIPVVRVNSRAAPLRPYFPSYLFAKLNLQGDHLNKVQWIPGLRRLVEIGGQPATVPENFILELQRHMTQMPAAGLRYYGMKRGDLVLIVNGPLAGYEALFDTRVSGTQRVRVLLQWITHSQGRQMVDRPIPVELEADKIQKIEPRRNA